MAPSYGSLSFREQIQFFRRKLNLPTESWTDIWQSDHDLSFVVAGANRDELVADFRAAIDKAIADGTTLEAFRKDFDEIVKGHGWSYKGSRGWRSRVIYETNLRTSYAAGRYAQLKDNTEAFPWWQYKHSELDKVPREYHITPAPAGLNGLVLAHDDPFWDIYFPPNGWGCTCYIQGISDGDLERLGKDGPDEAPAIETETVTVGTRGPNPRTVDVARGVDPGFSYAPGRAQYQALTPPPIEPPPNSLPPSATPAPASAPPLPVPRNASPSRLMPAGLDDARYVDAFLGEFDIVPPDRSTYYQDVAGEWLVISDALFRQADGALKVAKRGREIYTRLMAETIKSPDQIWVDIAELQGVPQVRRRYLSTWRIEGDDAPLLVVYEQGPAGWIGITAHDRSTTDNLIRSGQNGKLVYVRDDGQ